MVLADSPGKLTVYISPSNAAHLFAVCVNQCDAEQFGIVSPHPGADEVFPDYLALSLEELHNGTPFSATEGKGTLPLMFVPFFSKLCAIWYRAFSSSVDIHIVAR